MKERLPITLSDATGVPYYRQIVDQIAQLIRSRQLAPTARLPSVRELAGQLLVSLITIRRAYSDLENAGLIVRRQGQGTFVAEEVEMVTRKRALEEARRLLREAIAEARRLGLSEEEIRRYLLSALSGEEVGR